VFELYCFIDPQFLEVVDGTKIIEISTLDNNNFKIADKEKYLVKPLGRLRKGKRIFHDEFLLVGEIIELNGEDAVIRIGGLKIDAGTGIGMSNHFKIGDWVEFTADRLDAKICTDRLLPYKD